MPLKSPLLPVKSPLLPVNSPPLPVNSPLLPVNSPLLPVHFLGKVDEEREQSTQKFEEEALRLRAEQEVQLETLARKVST